MTTPEGNRDRKILQTVYFVFYYTVFLFFFIDHRLLSQYQPIFFNYNRDLSELLLIAAGIPRWMIAHSWSFMAADVLAFVLPAMLLGYSIQKGRHSLVLGIAFSCFLAFYLLLADIFWQVHHEPFILYLLLSFAFFTNRDDRFYLILKGCRYYFLYVFASAALWKLTRSAVFNGQEMSRILLIQHSDLLSDDCLSLSCRVYHYLIDHPVFSQCLYLAGFLAEASFLAGFFTRRWDQLLLGLAILFVAADLLVMRIPYWTVLLGGITLWIRPRRAAPPVERLVIYETTHHENLPALLDLGEARFSRVAVFLKEISYQNLSGQGRPAERWPRTEFFVQETSCSNRRFISRIFAFADKERVTHLHLSTLDNNLLYWAGRLAGCPVHVSLTVHEVNEYFAYPFFSLRDLTETMAKLLLHRRIRSYSLFLPAMAERLQQFLPRATAVFIPSRFYHPSAPLEKSSAPLEQFTPQFSAPASSDTPGQYFRIVIPGSVESNRRDYDQVLQFFSTWTPPRPVELVILGNSDSDYGADIVTRGQRMESPSFQFRYYKGYVPEAVYEQQLAEADLLWSPLKVHKKSSRRNPERYGQTTASGLTADLLLNNIPALVPAEFIVPEVFRAALLPYSSLEDAGVILDRCMSEPDHVYALRKKIDQAFSFFRKEHFNAAFQQLMGGPGTIEKEK